jgi:hypothetical protein
LAQKNQDLKEIDLRIYMFQMQAIFRFTIILFVFYFTANISIAQERFERMYRAGGTEIISSSLHANGEGFLILSLEVDDQGENTFINLSSLNPKGNVDWSMKYDYDDEDLYISELGEVEILADGSIAFSAYLQKDSLNKMITNVQSDGNINWTILTGNMTDKASDNGQRSNLSTLGSTGVLHITGNAIPLGTNIFMSAVSLSGELMWGQTISAMDTMGNTLSSRARDVIFLSDSTVLIVGNTLSANHQLFLTKMDTLGNILWSRSYTADLGNGISQSAMSVTEMLDSSIVVLAAQAGSNSNGMLLHVDRSGNYIESRSITSTNSNFDIIPVGIAPLSDSTLAIGLKRLDLINNEVRPLLVKFGLDSTIYYETLLKESTDMNPTRSGFISADGLSAAFLTSSTRVDSMTLYPYLSKVDESGMTDCSESISLLRFDSIFFFVDTLIWTSEEELEVDSVDVQAITFANFDPPLLQLTDTTYCPQDPIRYVLDATTRGATNYLWSDGSTDSTLLVTEEGMYMVTVVVGIEECFTLCDTATISKKEFPMVQIVQNNANFCSDGTILLTIESNNQVQQITWSTGETTPFIVVSDLKAYGVDIIDECDNPAQNSLNLTDFRIANNPSISVSGQNLCTDNTLLLVANGDFNVEDLIWSTGAVGVQSISISEPGNYTVENLAQYCPGEGRVNIIANQFLTPLTAEVSRTCTGDAFQLTAVVSSSATTIQWEDGSTAPTRRVTAAGTYAVVATDICGNSETASITISQNDINDCIETVTPPTEECDQNCVMWPNAIYPESNNEGNRTFGPELMECGNSTISNYEMKIFNRWGNVVFESNAPTTRWNGKKDNTGNDLPGDTYFYYALYSIDNIECNREGDILIIR